MLPSNHAMLLHFVLKVVAVVVLNSYKVECERGYCADHGYKPENGYRTPPAKEGSKYRAGHVISFHCLPPLVLNTSEYKQTCTTYDGYNYVWQPELLPSCLGIHDLSTDLMPHSLSDVFCKLSQSELLNGRIECCLGSRGTGNDSRYPDACCPRRGIVQFKCDSGYTLAGAASQWFCSDRGHWISLGDAYRTPTIPPKCYSNSTRTEEASVSDETLKQVFGVAAGVLVILSAVIIFALCRPKLINIKRRWREIRDDEDELIIDGRRITLPSYQEATTSRDMYDERNFDNPRDFSTDEQRTLAVSENDLSAALDNSSTEHLINYSDEGNGISSSQSLLLTAGTSIDACVMINAPPSTLSDGTDVFTTPEALAQDDDLWRTQCNESHSDCNLDSILPSSSGPAVAGQPVLMIDLERSLLNFPSLPGEDLSGSLLPPDSFDVVTISEDISAHDVKRETFDVNSAKAEEYEPKLECREEDDLCGPRLENSNRTYIKLASPTIGSSAEESDSTVV